MIHKFKQGDDFILLDVNSGAVHKLVPVYEHKVEAVGKNFERALEFVRELDLTPVTFCERRLEIREQ